MQSTHDSVKSLDIKEVVENVCASYQTSNNLDKVGMAQKKVNQVTSVMQENVKGMVKNIEDAEVRFAKFHHHRSSKNKATKFETTPTNS